MARHWCPSLEHFTPASLHFGSTGGPRTEIKEGEEEEDEERSPIYSLSKSSIDIVMATKHPHLRDPAWANLDLRRSASQNTHSYPNTHSQSLQLRSLQQSRKQNTPSQLNMPQNIHQYGSPFRNKSVERWSVCSGSVCSDGSSPDTVIWKEGASRPCSMNEETLCTPYFASCSHSQSSMQTQATPSPFTSPLDTPSPSPMLPPRTPTHQNRPSPLTPETTCQTHNALSVSSPTPATSPLPSPLNPKGCPINSYKESSPHNHLPSSSTCQSPSYKAEGVEERGSDRNVPPQTHCTTVRAYCGEKSPILGAKMLSTFPRHTCRSGRGQRWAGLVSSHSDSRLDVCPQCCCDSVCSGITNAMTSLPQAVFREEATMTSQKELVDVGVQVGSQSGSSLDFRSLQCTLKSPGSDIHLGFPTLPHIYMGSHSYLDSQSVLGSPPGSKLNLRSSLGSHSNLVSPSSSMFPPGSPGEVLEEADWEKVPLGELRRRRSCLKGALQEEDCRSGDHSRRRSSMKQVQWDEEGLTWDVYGAFLDPEELSSAIQKHLELNTRIDNMNIETKTTGKSKSKIRTDNLNTETTTKTKTKTMSIVKLMSKSKTKTPSMDTTPLSTPVMKTKVKMAFMETVTAPTPVTIKRKDAAPMATVVMPLSIHTMATATIENDVENNEERKQGETEDETGTWGQLKGERGAPQGEEREGDRERDEERQEEGDGKGGEDQRGQTGEETVEGGTLILSHKQSRKKCGRVMRSLKCCDPSSHPDD